MAQDNPNGGGPGSLYFKKIDGKDAASARQMQSDPMAVYKPADAIAAASNPPDNSNDLSQMRSKVGGGGSGGSNVFGRKKSGAGGAKKFGSGRGKLSRRRTF